MTKGYLSYGYALKMRHYGRQNAACYFSSKSPLLDPRFDALDDPQEIARAYVREHGLEEDLKG